MPDQLTPGGEIFDSETDRTMAAEIEWHLNYLLPEAYKLAPEDSPEARERRRLFAAIARGVVQHLVEHPQALQVVFTSVPAPDGSGEFAAYVQVAADPADLPLR
jgi:hypothetical protein